MLSLKQTNLEWRTHILLQAHGNIDKIHFTRRRNGDSRPLIFTNVQSCRFKHQIERYSHKLSQDLQRQKWRQSTANSIGVPWLLTVSLPQFGGLHMTWPLATLNSSIAVTPNNSQMLFSLWSLLLLFFLPTRLLQRYFQFVSFHPAST